MTRGTVLRGSEQHHCDRLSVSVANVYVSVCQIRIEDPDALVEAVQIAAGVARSSTLADNALRRAARGVRHRAGIRDAPEAACHLRHDLEIVVQFIVAAARADGRDLGDAAVARELSARVMQGIAGRRRRRGVGAMIRWFR